MFTVLLVLPASAAIAMYIWYVLKCIEFVTVVPGVGFCVSMLVKIGWRSVSVCNSIRFCSRCYRCCVVVNP